MDATAVCAGLYFSMRFERKKTSFNSTSYAQMVFSSLPPHVILLFRFFSIPLLLFKSQPGRVGKQKKNIQENSLFFFYFSRIAWLGGNESLGSCVCCVCPSSPPLLLLLSNLIISGCYFHQTQHASLFFFFSTIFFWMCVTIIVQGSGERKKKKR
jgi:hypothetical protein